MTLEIQHFKEVHKRGHALGRHVRHDPRSWAYPAPMASQLRTIRHNRIVPIFDQGELGSCTGNAAVGAISTTPFNHAGTEIEAISVYSDATQIDDADGAYPPDDTGSSGIAVAQVLVQRGWIKGYTHAFGIKHALQALMLGPGIVGISWREGCDSPDPSGVVRYTGAVRGGHEIELVGLDVDRSLVWFANSWGSQWGIVGYFAMTFSDFAKALADRGDVIFFSPMVP